MTNGNFDIVIAGRGLAGTLTAAFLCRSNPGLKIALAGRGGERPAQTWSFHAQDLSLQANDFLAPLVSCTWPGYSVEFPDHKRRIGLTYNSIRSEDYWRRIEEFLKDVVQIEGEIRAVSDTGVQLADGNVAIGRIVLDARGVRSKDFSNCGWQKFVGIEIETATPHGFREPVIMDATVPQRDGYRFFYLLPFSETHLLVEDTYYSDYPDLNEAMIQREIRRYLQSLGISSYSTMRQESGCLPIPLDQAWLAPQGGAEKIGMAGGFFHPTTGYSFPLTVKCAEELAHLVGRRGGIDQIPSAIRRSRADLARSSGFLVRLNRMLFRAGQPDYRWKILSQFYKRNEKVISSFYSGRIRFATALAMVTGIPPVPVLDGIRHFLTDQLPALPGRETQHG